MIRKRARLLMTVSAVLVLSMALSGCGITIVSGTKPTEPDRELTTAVTEAAAVVYDPPRIFSSEQNWDDGWISGHRTGCNRPGIREAGKRFETTDQRVYFMLCFDDLPLLYYTTHNADIAVPLCGQEYCRHDSERCDAWFCGDSSVCDYHDFLYVNSGAALYRMNPDGTERELVIDVREALEGDYDRIVQPCLWNGVFTFYAGKQIPTAADGENENEMTSGMDLYYYMLDGSMSQPKRMKPVTPLHNDGSAFLVQGTAESGGNRLLYEWKPGSNSLTLLLDTEALPEDSPAYGITDFTNGYWGRKSAHYLSEGILYRLNYKSGASEALFDTQLTGDYRLSCFQDCFVLCQAGDSVRLYIYDWEFRQLGYVEMPEAGGLSPETVICGESRDRIYLAAHRAGIPEYFIDKYDFGYRDITLYPIRYSSLDLEKEIENSDA